MSAPLTPSMSSRPPRTSASFSQCAFGSVMIIVQDFNVSPVARSFHTVRRPRGCDDLSIGAREVVRLSACPAIRSTQRPDDAAGSLERFAEVRLRRHGLNSRIERGKPHQILERLRDHQREIRPQRYSRALTRPSLKHALCRRGQKISRPASFSSHSAPTGRFEHHRHTIMNFRDHGELEGTEGR